MGHQIYLLLGGNIGDRRHYLDAGLEAIAARCGKVVCNSAFYETAAWGKEDQQAFLNRAVQVHTALSPHQVLAAIASIEQRLGRQRQEHWGARTLDIDIIFYDDLILQSPDLVIPHPNLHQRRFVLAPLSDVAPAFIHPVLQLSVEALLASCPDLLPVTRLA